MKNDTKDVLKPETRAEKIARKIGEDCGTGMECVNHGDLFYLLSERTRLLAANAELREALEEAREELVTRYNRDSHGKATIATIDAALASLAPSQSAEKPDWIALSRHLEIVKGLRAIVDAADALVKIIDSDEDGEGRYDVSVLARLKKLLPPRPGADAAQAQEKP